jgi:CRP-like cAMP-binding protein
MDALIMPTTALSVRPLSRLAGTAATIVGPGEDAGSSFLRGIEGVARARRGTCHRFSRARMADPPNSDDSAHNRLVAALPRRTRDELARLAVRVHLSTGEGLYKNDGPISHVFFPLTGVISFVVPMSSGPSAEVATVGNEGFVGLAVFHGVPKSSHEVFAQVPGSALRLDAKAFTALAKRDETLSDTLSLYCQAFIDQVSQSTACAHLHGVEQRMCRWLLMTQDRVGSNTLPLTQDFLAQMLGVRRATVNGVASLLQRSGLIMYERGLTTILSRAAMEKAACECYAVVRRRYEELWEGRT